MTAFALRERVPLAGLTTIGVGGPARWFVTATDAADVRASHNWCRDRGVPLWVLASFRLVTWGDEPAVFTIFHEISEQLAAEAALNASERRLVAQSDALTSLTARYTNPGEPFGERSWEVIASPEGRLRPRMRATAWVCDDARGPIIDWQPPETPGGEKRR